MQVLKFGGSSVANAENIKKVIEIVKQAHLKDKTIVVVSALGGITDLLINTANLAAIGDVNYQQQLKTIEQRHFDAVRELIPIAQQSHSLSLVKKCCNEIEDICNGVYLLRELTARTKDRVSSYGELLSSQIIADALTAEGVAVTWKDSRELIKTNDGFTNAEVNFTKTNGLVHDYFTQATGNLFLLPGFIAATDEGITTTLGRGGSDYTAAIYAAALDAAVLEIWTDVSGMMTADPRLASNARIIPVISYQEAMELSHFGAKVIYPPTIQPVLPKEIPVWIKNTFRPEDTGTLIQTRPGVTNADNNEYVKGISSINNISLLSLEGSGMVGIPGFSKRLFEALSSKKINVVLITQSSSEHSICVAVDSNNAAVAKAVVDAGFAYEIATQKVEPLKIESGHSIVALVGENMKSHPGISGKMFSALGRNGINIRAIAQGSSEKNISAVIATADVKKAINVLHGEFFEMASKPVHLFVVGTGNVGARLMEQIEKQHQLLARKYHFNVKVAGISNSRKMVLNEEGIHLPEWKTQLNEGVAANMQEFLNTIFEWNLPNSIFVDITASADVAEVYQQVLEQSISVVACNKIAAASAYNNYKNIKDAADTHNVKFLYETNVGAALPIISTLNDLVHSGDNIQRIEAVLSGTLNFVFNEYDGSKSFSAVVRQAQDEGYTEPDPRLDLSGVDVMRKIMILAREAGLKMEMEEVGNQKFLPESCMEGSVADFYAAMETEEPHFLQLWKEAEAKGCKLKFVASYDNGKASVGLQHISPEHNLYHLYGKDNIVLFYTDRYPDNPLVIKGAGAGADVTASGVFADILRAI